MNHDTPFSGASFSRPVRASPERGGWIVERKGHPLWVVFRQASSHVVKFLSGTPSTIRRQMCSLVRAERGRAR
jgi:hypothetical protein